MQTLWQDVAQDDALLRVTVQVEDFASDLVHLFWLDRRNL